MYFRCQLLELVLKWGEKYNKFEIKKSLTRKK